MLTIYDISSYILTKKFFFFAMFQTLKGIYFVWYYGQLSSFLRKPPSPSPFNKKNLPITRNEKQIKLLQVIIKTNNVVKN